MRCSNRRALVIPSAYAYSHTFSIRVGAYNSPPSSLYAFSNSLMSNRSTPRRRKILRWSSPNSSFTLGGNKYA